MGGINNPNQEWGHPALAVLKIPFDDQLNVATENGLFASPERGFHRYFLFPRPDIFESRKRGTVVSQVDILDGSTIVVKIGAGTVGWIYYYLDFNFEITSRLSVLTPHQFHVTVSVALCALISVIIPTLNEAQNLAATLDSLGAARDIETIVVDGGSSDATVDIATRRGARILHSSPGRARQMNAGSSVARGRILLFLHADSQLPPDFDQHVRRLAAQPDVAAGAFELKIEGDGPGLRLIERVVRFRSKRLQTPYGDQAIFLRSALFKDLGGFPEMPIMEDFEFVRRLRRRGRIALAPAGVKTSARRWLRLGIWRTTVLNWWIVAAYCLGVPSHRLARWYGRSTPPPSRTRSSTRAAEGG
ncbi:MAG: TIGR04283 family arsenosugar biosynthesis glycosyltransferase [Acidobacteriota bacterium]